jgi:hypothetical protein
METRHTFEALVYLSTFGLRRALIPPWRQPARDAEKFSQATMREAGPANSRRAGLASNCANAVGALLAHALHSHNVRRVAAAERAHRDAQNT